MALANDPHKGGMNTDKSGLYCSFCGQNGRFKDEGITLEEKIVENIQI